MQKTFYYCLFITFMLFQACNKDQTLTNRFDGEWDIEEITYTRNGKDSVVTAPIGIFYFEKCKLGTGGCPGYYELENYERVIIHYNAKSHPEGLHMSTLSEAQIRFSGAYTIGSISRKNISISGSAYIYTEQENASYDVKIDLRKK